MFRGVVELRLDTGEGPRRGEVVAGRPGEDRGGLLQQVVVVEPRDVEFLGLGALCLVVVRGGQSRGEGNQPQAAEEADRDAGATCEHRGLGLWDEAT